MDLNHRSPGPELENKKSISAAPGVAYGIAGHLFPLLNWVAVGTRVTPRPPHRSARAAFPHAALTEDVWRQSASWDRGGGFWATEAIAQPKQPCASSSSGSSGCDETAPGASVC